MAKSFFRISDLARKYLSSMIVLYHKAISPYLPAACRFTPTCSEYMAQAILKNGIFKGFFMGISRILRCHPFHPGGYDPVP